MLKFHWKCTQNGTKTIKDQAHDSAQGSMSCSTSFRLNFYKKVRRNSTRLFCVRATPFIKTIENMLTAMQISNGFEQN